MIRVWTDGCCLKNPGGPGGWAWVAERDGEYVDHDVGQADQTTNNVMELTAVIRALQSAPVSHNFEVISDSKYVVDGINSWVDGWKRRGWRRKGRGGKSLPVANEALWRKLDGLKQMKAEAGRIVVFRWVKGHDGQEFNEMADSLAEAAARGKGNICVSHL